MWGVYFFLHFLSKTRLCFVTLYPSFSPTWGDLQMYFFHVPSSALAVGANPSPVDAVNPIPGSKSVQNPVPVAKAVESSRVSQVDTKRSVNERKLDVPKVNGTSQASNFTSN
jgi:hypothetical protein